MLIGGGNKRGGFSLKDRLRGVMATPTVEFCNERKIERWLKVGIRSKWVAEIGNPNKWLTNWCQRRIR